MTTAHGPKWATIQDSGCWKGRPTQKTSGSLKPSTEDKRRLTIYYLPTPRAKTLWKLKNFKSFGSKTNLTSFDGKVWAEIHKIICSLFIRLCVNILTSHRWTEGESGVRTLARPLWGGYICAPYYLSKTILNFKTHLAPRVSDKRKKTVKLQKDDVRPLRKLLKA